MKKFTVDHIHRKTPSEPIQVKGKFAEVAVGALMVISSAAVGYWMRGDEKENNNTHLR